ncbi:MAG: LacI family DNA-binding transcriptional regulator [Pseudomonadota bacterium]
MTTMKDVATLANVSITTVSATLSGSAPVSAETQARVWEAVRRSNYRPDGVARNFRKGVSTTIGLIVPDIATPWAAHLARAMQRTLADQGYNMLFASNEDDPERERRDVDLMSEQRVAGLILAPTSLRADDADVLAARLPPAAVLVDRVVAGLARDAVTDDNALGAQLLAEYLARLGHCDIAFLAGRPTISASSERLAEFRAAMARGGVPLSDALVREGIWKREQAYAAVQALMSAPRPPTAIVCITIAQLMGTMEGLKNLSLRVPRDVSVVSFDGFHPAEGWYPAITSLEQNTSALARTAVDLLVGRISGKQGDAVRERVAPRLVLRESCAAA